MGRAGNTHRTDHRQSELAGVTAAGRPGDAPALAPQGAPGAQAQQHVWMLFVIAAAAIPTPEAKKRGGRRGLDEWEPDPLLQGYKS